MALAPTPSGRDLLARILNARAEDSTYPFRPSDGFADLTGVYPVLMALSVPASCPLRPEILAQLTAEERAWLENSAGKTAALEHLVAALEALE